MLFHFTLALKFNLLHKLDLLLKRIHTYLGKRGRGGGVVKCFLTSSVESDSSSPLLLHLPFPFSAPLAPTMYSNHHLGKPDKLRGRHQHLGVEELPWDSRQVNPTSAQRRLSTEVQKCHTPLYQFWPSCLCVSLWIHFSPSFPPSRDIYDCTLFKVKRFTSSIFVKRT